MCPWALHVVSVHAELTLGHLRYRLTDVPPQSNSPSDSVLDTGCRPVAQATVARDSPARTKDSAAARRRKGTRRRSVPLGADTARAWTSATRFRQSMLYSRSG